MGKNFRYVLDNFEYGGNIVDWLYCIKNFFGDEQTEAFCEYFINSHQILRKNDIRNVISHHSISVFSCKNKEQLAFASVFVPFDMNSNFMKKQENGLERIQNFYRDKSIKFSKEIKKLGYSYSTIKGNWKDKTEKNTYQREYVFAIYSEKDTEEQFKNNIIELLKKHNIPSVLITDRLENNQPKLTIKSKLFDVKTGEILNEYDDTTMETVEKYFSDISNTKFVFKIPYEKNKNVLYLDASIADYYSKNKQEKVKNATVTSMNMGMFKQSLLSSFSRENYNK